VHALALTLSLAISPPADAPVELTEPPTQAEPEPLPDLEPAPEPVAGPIPEPIPEPEPTPEPAPIPPAGDDQALAASTATPPVPAKRDRLGCDGSKACRKMSSAGIVVGSLGLIAIGAGIGLLVNRDEVIPEYPIFVHTTHPPGLVAVTIGTGVVLTSALMLGAAHKGYKQLPNETSRVQLGPTGLRF
jgi:hypothetical protein